MWLTSLTTGIGLLILGFLIKKYKMSYLIAGYNTASKKEKDKYDEVKLVRHIGNYLMISAGILILAGTLAFFLVDLKKEIIFISWILFSAYVIVWLIYINVGGCVKKTNNGNNDISNYLTKNEKKIIK